MKILAIVAALLSAFGATGYIRAAHHKFKILDVVTQEPVEGIKLAFSFADHCHSTDEYRLDYDYSTCDGRYRAIENRVSNKAGIIEFWTFPGLLHPVSFRFTVARSPGYHSTPNGASNQTNIWLVPKNAPLPTKEAAIDYLSQEQPIRQIMAFYESNGLKAKYSRIEDAWYGVWSVGIEVAHPRIRNGQNPEIVQGQWSEYPGVTVLVHPGTKEYVICNPWKDRKSRGVSLIGLEQGEVSEFFSRLEKTHTYPLGSEGCRASLLLPD